MAKKEEPRNLLWVLPAVVFLAVFTLYPLGFLLATSFTNTQLTQQISNFVGLKNFQTFFADQVANKALQNSLLFMFGGATVTMGLALVLGLFLNLEFRFNRVVRLLILIPWAFSLVDVSLLWKWMLNAHVGLMNWLLIWGGIIKTGIFWLGEPDLAMFSIIFVMAWYLTPLMTLLILASLHGVNPELYAAASLDGAHKWGRFRYFTWPALQYPIVIGALMTAIWFGNSLDVVFVMTQGGPINATQLLPFYMFSTIYNYLSVGYGSAIGLVNSVILAAFAGVYLYIFRRYWRGG